VTDGSLALEGRVAFVAVAARSEQPGKPAGTIGSVADAITASGGRALPVTCDVTDEESVDAAAVEAVSEFGGIDILAAFVTGVFLVTKAAIPTCGRAAAVR
jgi:citronellol/citronellal dehydrogenase